MDSARIRLLIVMGIMLACIATLTGRLFFIQVISNTQYAEKSRGQAQQRMIIPAHRGSIFDRNGNLLATTLKMPITFQKSDTGTASFKNGVSRVYPYGSLGGAVVGYTGKDTYGQGGVELSCDADLRGEDGWAIVMRDARNTRYRKANLPSKSPVDGSDVVLSIDIKLQEVVQKTLGQTIARFSARGGMAMILDPHSGEILAMADELGFNPNQISNFPLSSRRIKCVTDIYEPGSTFKVITSATALMEKVMDEKDSINGDGGAYVVFNETIRDHKPYGMLSFTEALAYSSNVCFAKIANTIGNDRLYTSVKNFGFGAKSGIRLPGEEGGIVHPISNWSGRSRVTIAIGQEVSVTFLQMMLAFSAVANDGVLLAPTLIRSTEDGMNGQSAKARPIRRVMPADVATRLRKMMTAVVVYGTGKTAALNGIEVGGKTGTSQKVDIETNQYSNSLYCSSFIGFAPVQNPTLVCGVLIDEPLAGETGGMTAAPAFSEILHQIISRPDLAYAEKMLPTNADSISQRVKALVMAKATEGISKNTIVTKKNDTLDAALSNSQNLQKELAEKKSLADSSKTPSYVGKELRFVLGDLYGRGIVPSVKGFGTVVKQRLLMSDNNAVAACTLYCSIGG